MPEGVECLLVAEHIQKWMFEQDETKRGKIKIYVKDNFCQAVVRNSPFPFESFNNTFGNVCYNKITTFGKNIFIPSDNGKILVVRLGMTGTFSETENKYTRVSFQCLSSYGESFLYYNDIRKFGTLIVVDNSCVPKYLSKVLRNSIEWRDSKAPELFLKKIRRRRAWVNAEIKNVLINQFVISGIGNIYASEALFDSKINPKNLVRKLNDEDLKSIIKSAQKIMNQSYIDGGMTVSTFSFFDKKGTAQYKLKVYGKNGTICSFCKSNTIKKIQQAKRATFYCPRCQIEKDALREKKFTRKRKKKIKPLFPK